MPKSTEQSRKCAAETPFPQGKSRDHAQKIAHPQVSPADAEEGEEPANRQIQTDERLRQTIDELGTTDSIRQIARDERGLVDPDTIIIEDAH